MTEYRKETKSHHTAKCPGVFSRSFPYGGHGIEDETYKQSHKADHNHISTVGFHTNSSILNSEVSLCLIYGNPIYRLKHVRSSEH